MHYNLVEKLLSPHRFGHSVFIGRKIANIVFTIFFWYTLYPISWKVNNPVRVLLQWFISVTWCNCFYKCAEDPRNVSARRLLELLEKSTLSIKIFFIVLIKSAEGKSEKHVSVAPSEKCYLISTGSSIFVSYIQLSCNKLII